MSDKLVITNLLYGSLPLGNNKIAKHPFNDFIQHLIEKSWCAKTSLFPDHWTSANPAMGQCAVTALLIQDMIGGEIVGFYIKGFGWHFWNMRTCENNVVVEYDLTRGQFPDDLKIQCYSASAFIRIFARQTILRDETAKKFKTSKRYRLLRDRFLQFMRDELYLRVDR